MAYPPIVINGPQGATIAPLADLPLIAAATGAYPAAGVPVGGYNGAQILELRVVDTGVHAITGTVEGSFDGVNWYVAGIQKIGDQSSGVATPARAASFTIASINGTVRQVWQVLDPYEFLRLNISANTLAGSGAGMTCNLYLVPV